jgi:hypothetical protein
LIDNYYDFPYNDAERHFSDMTKETEIPKLKLRKRGSYSPDGGEIEVTGVLADRIVNGRRRLMLTKGEKSALKRQRLVEQAVAMFLDIDQDHSWQEIAGKLGVSIPALKDLTKTEEFMDAYSQYFVDLGHDPRVKATQAAVADMLPLAMRELRNLITGTRVSGSAKLNAIKEIFRLSGLDAPKTQGSDRTELAEFLKTQGVNVEQMNVVLPPEYLDAMKRYAVDGIYTPAPDRRKDTAALPASEASTVEDEDPGGELDPTED